MKTVKAFFLFIFALLFSSFDGVKTNGGKLDNLLDSMLEDFEKSNFDAHEALNLTPAEVEAYKKVSNRVKSVADANGVKMYGQIGNPDTITSLVTQSKGDLNITVLRVTANLAVPLPYILFGLQGFSSSFQSTLKPYLPSGVTCTATNSATTGNMVLTYTDGIVTDTIQISLSGGLISYSEFLQSMNQNYFKTKYVRYEVADDANRLSQQSQMINFGLLSALGQKNANQLLVRSRIQSWTYQKSITELLMPEQKITSDFSFVQNAIAVASYSIAWDVFMSDRVNLNKIS